MARLKPERIKQNPVAVVASQAQPAMEDRQPTVGILVHLHRRPDEVRTQGNSPGSVVGRNGFAEDAGSEVEWIGECILSEGGQGCPSELQRKETTMSPLRARMIEDMTLAGLAEGTQKVYVQAVRGVTAHYRRSPDLLSEEEVRGYLLGLRQRGVARGTFQTSRYGLRFFYHHTLDRAWALFGEKKDRLATTEAAA